MAGLSSAIVVSGLLRAAEAAGGNGVVLVRGDPDVGALMLVLTCRGAGPILLERLSTLDGAWRWNQLKSDESTDSQRVARLVDKKKQFDRDLWALELDIPNVEQFIVDSLGST